MPPEFPGLLKAHTKFLDGMFRIISQLYNEKRSEESFRWTSTRCGMVLMFLLGFIILKVSPSCFKTTACSFVNLF